MPVTIKSPEEQQMMREAGRVTADVLIMIEEHVRPGVTTAELDQICHDYIVDTIGGIPAPLNYRGFPKSVCTSINDVVCHGIPGNKRLKNGDIVNIDVSVIKDGWHGDSSRMFMIGDVSPLARKLCKVTHAAMRSGIEMVRPGVQLGDIGSEIQKIAETEGYSIVREYCGHGIGREFHEDPQVLHYGRPGSGMALQPGMTFTIEPMVNAGRRQTKLSKKDGWTVTTKDRSLSAQWEHTILVTDDGFEVLTLRNGEI